MNDTPKKSRILTLVFTDLVSSTALKTEKGDDAVGDLIARHREHVTRLAEECNGRIIDWAGDGCFLTFETSSAAVMFSLRLQQAHAEEADLPGVRIGLHMGEVTEGPGPGEAPRIEGLAVDIAARVGSLAKPGQVLMSSAVYSSARQRLGVDTFGQPILWQAHGTYSLKGFDQPVDIGEAGLEGLSPLEAPTAGDKAHLIKRAPKSARSKSGSTSRRPSGLPKFAALTSLIVVTLALGLWLGREYGGTPDTAQPADAYAPITSLAVLPLDNLMNDPEQDYFVDGMTEAIISELAKIKALKVISRTSVMRYKGTTKPLPEIARELGVDAILEGSLLKVDNEIRLTVQLIHGATDMHLWAESYTAQLENILSLQGELALAVAREIEITLTPEESKQMATAPPVNPAAYEEYLRGTYFYYKFSKDGFERARQAFEGAIELDPNFALAHAWLAQSLWAPSWWFSSPASVEQHIKKAIADALALDPNNAQAHVIAGWVAMTYDWDWVASEREFRTAIDLNPGYPDAHGGLAWYMTSLGRFDEAIAAQETAMKLTPLSVAWLTFLGDHMVMADRMDDALQKYEAALDLDPNYWLAHIGRASVYSETGRAQEAIEILESSIDISGRDPNLLAALTHPFVREGRKDEARAIANELRERRSTEEILPALLAQAYAAIGEMNEAYRWLDQCLEERSFTLILPHARLWSPFWGEARFEALLRRMNYPGELPKAPATRRATGTAPIERIAVLPFANISGDPEQEWFVDGMTEALTMELAKIKALTVVSRTSAMQFKGVIRPMQEIARELGVDAIIEGSVFRVGDKVRITAQLIDGRTDRHLWADRYDGTLDDILNLQSEVALAIAKEIHIVLTPEEETRLTTPRTIDPKAHEAYLRGRHLWNKRTKAEILRAIELFKEVTRIEPGYALGYAAIADAYSFLGTYTYAPPEEAFEKAIESVRKALEIDDSLAAAHASLGLMLCYGYYDFDGASREFERALELDPKSVEAYAWYAALLRYMNRPEQGLEMVERALALDPLSTVANAIKVGALYYAGRPEEAIEFGRNFLEIEPNSPLMLGVLGVYVQDFGDYDDAIVLYERAAELTGRGGANLGSLGMAYAIAGRREDALAILEEVESNPVTEATGAYDMAMVHFGLGDIERTLTLLEQSIEERHRGILSIYSERLWDPLRDEPRFQAIIEKLNFPE